ncbi:hypothetical protein ACHAWX_004517 [Stephanocyclus meneghinianus]
MPSLLDEAFSLLEEAILLEREASKDDSSKHKSSTRSHAQTSGEDSGGLSSCRSLLEHASKKFHEACYLMKRHASSTSFNGTSSDDTEMRTLIIEKIEHYEQRAKDLAKKAKECKDQANSQASEKDSDQDKRSFVLVSNRSPISSWEDNHSSRLESSPHVMVFDQRAFDNNKSNGRNNESALQTEGKASLCLSSAIRLDENGEFSTAIEHYISSAHFYLEAVKALSEDITETETSLNQVFHAALSNNDLIASLKRKFNMALDRVEELKKRAASSSGRDHIDVRSNGGRKSSNINDKLKNLASHKSTQGQSLSYDFTFQGWIPERIFLPEDASDVRDFETPVERAWERLYSANSYGYCLITVSTSKELTEEKAAEVGLLTAHAYAVLAVIQTTNGTRLLKLKNPWTSQGWKGEYSSNDTVRWGDPNFCAEVGYDAVTASVNDGVFYISWDDVLIYFRNLHLSWNPALLHHRTTTHGLWSKELGPADDSFNIGENPQYIVNLSKSAIENHATLWILLTRHVTKQKQEGRDVSDCLTLHIHRTTSSRRRVWYPGGSNCVLTGAYTNNQHILIRYDVEGPSDKHLSIVLSQYNKSNDLCYTLSCYCTESFKLSQPEETLRWCRVLNGSWELRDNTSPENQNSLLIGTAGGPPGKGSFGSNPQWSLVVAQETFIQCKCTTKKSLAVNVVLVHTVFANNSDISGLQMRGKRVHHLYEAPLVDSGDYRYGFVATERVLLQPGSYTIVVSTYEVGEVGSFILHVMSDNQVDIDAIR